MFSTPLPRTSFLDSSLRSQGLRTRRMHTRQPLAASHLGRGPRLAADRETIAARRTEPVSTAR